MPVGNASRAFSGTVYGGNTVIQNAKLGYYSTGGRDYSGLFGNTNGAKFYDLTIASNCSSVLTGSYDFGTTNFPFIGGFTTIATSPTFVNCTSRLPVNIVNTHSAATSSSLIAGTGLVGGFVGRITGTGTSKFVGCAYINNINFQGHSGTLASTGDDSSFGNFIGEIVSATTHTLIVSGAYIKSSMVIRNNGSHSGSIIGSVGGSVGLTLTLKNAVVEFNLDYFDTAGLKYGQSGYRGGSPDAGVLLGYTGANYKAGSSMTNVFLSGDYTKGAWGSSEGWLTNTNITKTNVYSNYVSSLAPNLTTHTTAEVTNAKKTNTAIQNEIGRAHV